VRGGGQVVPVSSVLAVGDTAPTAADESNAAFVKPRGKPVVLEAGY
jgi:hypothetical protein